MIHNNEHGIPQVPIGPIDWLDRSLRSLIREAVADHLGGGWDISVEKDLSEFACHRCAVLADRSFAVFFKYSTSPRAVEQFETELSGLRTLAAKAGVRIPKCVGTIPLDQGALLILEALEEIERGPRQWRDIGTALARLHSVEGTFHGFERDGFWGPLHQDNTPSPDWVSFFRERRLLPLLRAATDSGNLPPEIVSQVERLIPRLPELCGPEHAPVLLHGDAQQNNFVSTADGAYVIDPAVFYGHPEWDLAQLDSWRSIPDTVLEGYREILSIDPGFTERRSLWRLPLYLAAVAIEGTPHLPRLAGALEEYK